MTRSVLPVTWRAELAWDQAQKRWVLTTIRQRIRGVESRRRVVETTEPLDQANARALERVIVSEMLAWLPFGDDWAPGD